MAQLTSAQREIFLQRIMGEIMDDFFQEMEFSAEEMEGVFKRNCDLRQDFDEIIPIYAQYYDLKKKLSERLTSFKSQVQKELPEFYGVIKYRSDISESDREQYMDFMNRIARREAGAIDYDYNKIRQELKDDLLLSERGRGESVESCLKRLTESSIEKFKNENYQLK